MNMGDGDTVLGKSAPAMRELVLTEQQHDLLVANLRTRARMLDARAKRDALEGMYQRALAHDTASAELSELVADLLHSKQDRFDALGIVIEKKG